VNRIPDGVDINLDRCFSKEHDFTAITADNREQVIELLRATKCGFKISMPCGEGISLDKDAEFSGEDIPCTCGRKNHYFIQYRK